MVFRAFIDARHLRLFTVSSSSLSTIDLFALGSGYSGKLLLLRKLLFSRCGAEVVLMTVVVRKFMTGVLTKHTSTSNFLSSNRATIIFSTDLPTACTSSNATLLLFLHIFDFFELFFLQVLEQNLIFLIEWGNATRDSSSSCWSNFIRDSLVGFRWSALRLSWRYFTRWLLLMLFKRGRWVCGGVFL